MQYTFYEKDRPLKMKRIRSKMATLQNPVFGICNSVGFSTSLFIELFAGLGREATLNSLS